VVRGSGGVGSGEAVSILLLLDERPVLLCGTDGCNLTTVVGMWHETVGSFSHRILQ
jgi:hypothetical protein